MSRGVSAKHFHARLDVSVLISMTIPEGHLKMLPFILYKLTAVPRFRNLRQAVAHVGRYSRETVRNQNAGILG